MSKKALESIRQLLSRRRTLQGTAALVSTAAVGCGDDDVSGEGTDSGSSSTGDGTTSGSGGSTSSTTGDDSTTSTSSSTGSDETSDGSSSGSTGEGGELTPEELLANVDHIIVVCMENRSFDHYLGALQVAEGVEVDGLAGNETNPDQNGVDVPVFEMDNFEPDDPPHGWGSCHSQWNDGANDGFVTEHFDSHGDAVKHEVMGYHVREHLPVLYALADAYTVCDRWFCSLLSSTWPNRYYLHCADSSGTTGNTPASPLPRSIQDLCDDTGITNMNYFDGLAAWRWGGFPVTGFSGTAGISQFFDKLQNGGLEQVVIIDPDFLSNDDHPAHNIQLGQAFIGSVYQALAQSQYWERSLLIITYDEHGGFFDHVDPPTTTDDNGPEFEQMGFRVPTVVIGPHVRKGEVVSTVFEHASFASTVSLRFGLPQLNERSTAATDVSSCIDPAYVDDPQPPAPIPMLAIDDGEVLAGAGLRTSQTELFDAVQIAVPLRGEALARHRRMLQQQLDRGRRLGVIRS